MPVADRTPRRRWPGPVACARMLAALGLLLSAQERTLGVITDEQQAIGTAIAIATTGEVGLPSGFAFSIPRDAGDTVAPYGLGLPLVLAPVALACKPFEARFGSGTSQSLLILVPLALVFAAALFAGLIARAAGAGAAGEALAILGTVASPLLPLGSTFFSEPLLAACLAGAAACAALAARADAPSCGGRERCLIVAAGLLAGLAVLTKSLAIAAAPACLLPLARLPWRRGAWAIAGLAPAGIAWLAGEIARFGVPLSSYAGQPFSHPPLDGAWRLLIGPNEGLLIHFPLAAAGLAGLAILARGRTTRWLAGALGVPPLVLLALTSAWWAWDGSAGWGPRLLAPAIPLLSAAAGCWFARVGRAGRVAALGLVIAGAGVTALGVAQPDASVMLYVDSCGPAPVPDAEVSRWPAGMARTMGPGERRISQSMAAVTRPAFAPARLHAFVIAGRARPASTDERLARLRDQAPWRARWPALVPSPSGLQGDLSGVLFNLLVDDLVWPMWGDALRAERVERRTRFTAAWQDAIEDQALRALDLGLPDRAVRLATPLFQIASHDRSAALLAESLRASGDGEALARLLAALPPRTLGKPEMLATRALIARDAGNDAEARDLLRQLAESVRAPATIAALESPLGSWPATTRPFLSPEAPWRPGDGGRSRPDAIPSPPLLEGTAPP